MSKPLPPQRRARGKQCGFSIVEMMVAVLIGLFLMAGAISMLVTSKRTYTIQEDLSRIQENARFAMEFLARDLRMAGYFGCADDLTSVFNHVNGASGGSILDTGIPVEGYEQGDTEWRPTGSTEGVDLIRAGTDAITVRYLQPLEVTVTSQMPSPSANLPISQPNDLLKGEIVAVTDCASADIFQISNPDTPNPNHLVHNTGAGTLPGNNNSNFPDCPGAAQNCLSKQYGPPQGEIMRLAAYRYFVGNDADGNPALFRTSLALTGATPTVSGTPVQLIDGVENMQITYGVDTTGDRVANEYLSADGAVGSIDLTNPDGWNNVVSVRIGLLLRSVEEAGPDRDTGSYLVNGEAIDGPNDRRRRRVFTSTILLRNLQTR